MAEYDVSDEKVFVVRFWTAGDVGWRGCVDHVASGDRCFFVELTTLAGFITTRLALPD